MQGRDGIHLPNHPSSTNWHIYPPLSVHQSIRLSHLPSLYSLILPSASLTRPPVTSHPYVTSHSHHLCIIYLYQFISHPSVHQPTLPLTYAPFIYPSPHPPLVYPPVSHLSIHLLT